jgi:hypothetical protein
MQGDDLEVGGSRRIRDGEGTTLHIWRSGTGNLVLDNQSASGWHRPLRLGSSPLCCSALATWELDMTTHTYDINICHIHCSVSSLLFRNLESCPCALWLAGLGDLAGNSRDRSCSKGDYDPVGIRIAVDAATGR